MAADEKGKLLAMEWDFLMDHGAYSEFGDLLTIKICRNIGAGYDIPNISGRGRSTFTNHAFGSAFRGYGSPQAEFASEVLMDELAEKAGIDPLEFRYINVYRPGDDADRRRARRASIAGVTGHDEAQVPRRPRARPA